MFCKLTQLLQLTKFYRHRLKSRVKATPTAAPMKNRMLHSSIRFLLRSARIRLLRSVLPSIKLLTRAWSLSCCAWCALAHWLRPASR